MRVRCRRSRPVRRSGIAAGRPSPNSPSSSSETPGRAKPLSARERKAEARAAHSAEQKGGVRLPLQDQAVYEAVASLVGGDVPRDIRELYTMGRVILHHSSASLINLRTQVENRTSAAAEIKVYMKDGKEWVRADACVRLETSIDLPKDEFDKIGVKGVEKLLAKEMRNTFCALTDVSMEQLERMIGDRFVEVRNAAKKSLVTYVGGSLPDAESVRRDDAAMDAADVEMVAAGDSDASPVRVRKEEGSPSGRCREEPAGLVAVAQGPPSSSLAEPMVVDLTGSASSVVVPESKKAKKVQIDPDLSTAVAASKFVGAAVRSVSLARSPEKEKWLAQVLTARYAVVAPRMGQPRKPMGELYPPPHLSKEISQQAKLLELLSQTSGDQWEVTLLQDGGFYIDNLGELESNLGGRKVSPVTFNEDTWL